MLRGRRDLTGRPRASFLGVGFGHGRDGGAVSDAQIKPLQPQPQPSGSEALEMPATPLPLARELDWSEHFSFFSSEGDATDGARDVGLTSSVCRLADSVTQQQRHWLDSGADERAEELTERNCISYSDAQPDASAAGSKKPEPHVYKGTSSTWWNATDVSVYSRMVLT